MTEVTSIKTVAARLRRMTREPKAESDSAPSTAAVNAKPQTKSSLVLELLACPDGATLNQLVEATGWLPHTARAALTGLKKKGYAISSVKPEEGARTYQIATEHTPSAGSAASEPAEPTA